MRTTKCHDIVWPIGGWLVVSPMSTPLWYFARWNRKPKQPLFYKRRKRLENHPFLLPPVPPFHTHNTHSFFLFSFFYYSTYQETLIQIQFPSLFLKQSKVTTHTHCTGCADQRVLVHSIYLFSPISRNTLSNVSLFVPYPYLILQASS